MPLIELVIFALMVIGWGAAMVLAILLVTAWRKRSASPADVLPALKRRAEPETYRSIEWKGLIFRSQSEVKIAKTLDHRGIFFIPATRVRMNAGKHDERQTRELDFVICHDGKWGILEVDGPFHVRELDSERDRLLHTHGIINIQRFPAERCYQQPQAVVDEFLHHLENQL